MQCTHCAFYLFGKHAVANLAFDANELRWKRCIMAIKLYQLHIYSFLISTFILLATHCTRREHSNMMIVIYYNMLATYGLDFYDEPLAPLWSRTDHSRVGNHVLFQHCQRYVVIYSLILRVISPSPLIGRMSRRPLALYFPVITTGTWKLNSITFFALSNLKT